MALKLAKLYAVLNEMKPSRDDHVPCWASLTLSASLLLMRKGEKKSLNLVPFGSDVRAIPAFRFAPYGLH